MSRLQNTMQRKKMKVKVLRDTLKEFTSNLNKTYTVIIIQGTSSSLKSSKRWTKLAVFKLLWKKCIKLHILIYNGISQTF